MQNFLSSPASGYILLGIIIGMFIMAFAQLKKDKSYKTGEEDAQEKNPFISKYTPPKK
ncbi:hypothetical protein GW884_01725 [Candidatus Falkowbacteria bacterium]|nr:hypothetical protein [Candidatus Falkowbacteria bacterium]